MFLFRPATAFAALLLVAHPLESQELITARTPAVGAVRADDPDTIPAYAVASTYQAVDEQMRELRPRRDRVALINEPVTLERDGISLTFSSGRMVQLGDVSGRTIGVGFLGRGTYRVAPTGTVEREQLMRRFDESPLERTMVRAVVIFGDETLAELETVLDFNATDDVDLGNTPDRTYEYLFELSPETGPDVMRTILNGRRNGLFYAHVKPERGADMILMFDPWSAEPNILRRVEGDGESRIVSQFGERAERSGDRLGDATVSHYDLEVWMPRTAAGNLSFSAIADLDVVAASEVGPWLPFYLYPDMEIDSVLAGDGSVLAFYEGDESAYFWIRAGQTVGPGDTISVKVFYSGELLDRVGDFFFHETSISWYPRSLSGRARATFATVYHTPASYEFAGSGELVESTSDGDMITTRWVNPTPARNISFNIGPFERYVEEGGSPGVTVLFSEEYHRQARQEIPSRLTGARLVWVDQPRQDSHPERQVGADIRNSMNFFENVFGPNGLEQFYATEIPYFHGEAFPGLVHLSVMTFVETASDGGDEWFRAHEVAHQWWAVGVDYATYRDQWLSEGLASFSALWYLQSVRGGNDEYFRMLRDWRENLGPARGDPDDPDRGWGPIALGYRVSHYDEERAYNTIVYQKGAWVVHMLRTMMLDLRTMDETPFTEMMRDLFLSYRGGEASTDDFQRIAEEHIGMPMNWFFDQWVRGTYVPKYNVRWKTEEADNGRWRLRISVSTEHVPEGFRAYVPIAVDFGDNRQARLRVEVLGGEGELQLPLMPLRPRGIDFNALEGVLAEVDVSPWR